MISFKRVLLIGILGALSVLPAAFGETEEEAEQASGPKQIGGLLFDFDEGVEIKKGPGGSVYVESNREFMQNKFRTIDSRFEELEKRIEHLESFIDDDEPLIEDEKTQNEGRRVLAT